MSLIIRISLPHNRDFAGTLHVDSDPAFGSVPVAGRSHSRIAEAHNNRFAILFCLTATLRTEATLCAQY